MEFVQFIKVENVATGDFQEKHYDGFLTKQEYSDYWWNYFKVKDRQLRKRIHSKLRKRK